MSKRKLTDRLQLLNGGRLFYLDFLRNLTPQIILFSIALLLWARLDFTRFDFDNTLPTVVFFVILGSFILAFYANSTLLYERCFAEWKQWLSDIDKSLTAQGVKGPRRLVAKLQAVWRDRFVEFIEIFIVLWFLQVALAIVVAMSMHSASSIWRANHHAGSLKKHLPSN